MSRVDIAIRRSDQLLSELQQNIHLARKEIDELKSDRAQLDVEMRVSDIARFLGCDESTVYRKLSKPPEEGGLRSRKMIDVLEYQKG